ncbi:hypothetical protein T4A_10447 [Trichinella pseudospiralis]|uniref:Uncharacterized protein n=1 Tax=Trichinella pseudospiralis TaxID=6337 RepID=A0A0V1JWW9_TRIPS|nr:hypothetical protein T4A_10447 [Trichinella pseudospiralis]KRZ39463.1 hypothetical protein T4C_3280 [Trichinella pseudospiralis]
MVNSCGAIAMVMDLTLWTILKGWWMERRELIGRLLNECIFCSLCCGYVMLDNLVSAGCYSLALPPRARLINQLHILSRRPC